MFAQRKLKSACASMQSDQSHRFSHGETLLLYPKCTYSDLSFSWAHMCIDMFSDVAALSYCRSTAYGVHNTSARIGGMIAPQIVFLVFVLLARPFVHLNPS